MKPLLKKPSLVKDELKNYRSVSNHHFISKVIEKLVAKRLEEHMSEYSMYNPMQSAYKLVHSTETALVKINYDILSSLDAGKCTVLVSLDFSAAFDTISHNVLLLLVVSLHQSDPLSDTFFCDIVVNHEIIKRACLSQQRALEEMLHRLISFFTITRGVILICIFPLS